MMDINNTKWESMSDNSLVETIGGFIRHHRLLQNKTQDQLARDAGINRSTLVAFEKGNRSNLITLIQLLRALNLLDVMQQFKIQQELSPIQLAELDSAKRKRASKKKSGKKRPKSTW